MSDDRVFIWFDISPFVDHVKVEDVTPPDVDALTSGIPGLTLLGPITIHNTFNYLTDERHAATTEWLRSKGFVEDKGSMWYAWSTRIGIDTTSLGFWPHVKGWDVIVGCHASGENPRLNIGTCETLEDVQMVCETIRRINGYEKPEEFRGPT